MTRLKALAILMGIAILGITGFQVYWLKDNYAREKRSMNLKTQAAFREAMLELQVSKMNLGNLDLDTTKGRVKVIMNNDFEKEVKVTFKPREKIASTINILRSKLRDSLKTQETPPKLIISMDKNSTNPVRDSLKIKKHVLPGGPGNERIVNLLYGVDSLQDSLRLKDIDSAFHKKLIEEKMDIPYTITRETGEETEEDSFDSFTVGLANPVTYTMKTGNTFPYLIKKISLPILFSIILIGITILSFVLLYRNMLKQHRLAELKNEFISNITHELKTPIATVGVAVEALKNFNAMQDPAKTKEYLEISSNELQRLGFLVDKVLKLSMFEKKEVELKYEYVDMRELVNEVTDSLKLQLEKYNARLEVFQQGDVQLKGDRLHLLSVIFNLLDNALKYSKGAPYIKIDLTGKTNEIEIKVADNGIGIPAAYREKIFEKFFRVPHGDVHNAKGYGLGLSYVSQIVRKHKGTIHVESEENSGTTFIVTLPKNLI